MPQQLLSVRLLFIWFLKEIPNAEFVMKHPNWSLSERTWILYICSLNNFNNIFEALSRFFLQHNAIQDGHRAQYEQSLLLSHNLIIAPFSFVRKSCYCRLLKAAYRRESFQIILFWFFSLWEKIMLRILHMSEIIMCAGQTALTVEPELGGLIPSFLTE